MAVALVALSLALLLLAPGTAGATPGMRTGPKRVGADLSALRRFSGVRLPGLIPRRVGQANSRQRFADLVIPIHAGSAYRKLQIQAWQTAEGAFLTVATYRYDAASNSNQFFLRQYRVPRGSLDIANDLSRVSIHTGSSLGTLGSIDLDLSTGTVPDHSGNRCPTTGKQLSMALMRRVEVSGTVDLSLGIATIPEPFQASTARGRAFRETFTGARCPQPQRCYPYAGFGAWDKGAETSLLFDREGTVDVIHEDATWRSTSLSWLTRYPTSEQPVTIAHDTVTFDGTLASPFLDGVLKFDRSGPPTERMWGPCRFIHVPFAWTSGILDVLWDTGTQTLGGPWRHVQLYRWRRP